MRTLSKVPVSMIGGCSESNNLQKSTEDLPAVSFIAQREFTKKMETDFAQWCPVKV